MIDFLSMIKGLMTAQVVLATECPRPQAQAAIQAGVDERRYDPIDTESIAAIVLEAVASVREANHQHDWSYSGSFQTTEHEDEEHDFRVCRVCSVKQEWTGPALHPPHEPVWRTIP